MKQLYKAVLGKSVFTGTRTELAKKLGVSRQCVHQAIENKNLCKGYELTFVTSQVPKTYASQKKQIAIAIKLLKESKEVIDNYNKYLESIGEYPNIGLSKNIEIFLERP